MNVLKKKLPLSICSLESKSKRVFQPRVKDTEFISPEPLNCLAPFLYCIINPMNSILHLHTGHLHLAAPCPSVAGWSSWTLKTHNLLLYAATSRMASCFHHRSSLFILGPIEGSRVLLRSYHFVCACMKSVERNEG